MSGPPLTYERISEDRLPLLVDLLTSERWNLFGRPELTEDDVRASWRDGDYAGPDNEGFLILGQSGDVVGMLRLFDLRDPTALFDIRLQSSARGVGNGTVSVEWVIRYIFDKPAISRLEANTRRDNDAMRATLRRCGFVKEGHHRAADPDGHDWVTYCLLRRDHDRGTTTMVEWDDEPHVS